MNFLYSHMKFLFSHMKSYLKIVMECILMVLVKGRSTPYKDPPVLRLYAAGWNFV